MCSLDAPGVVGSKETFLMHHRVPLPLLGIVAASLCAAAAHGQSAFAVADQLGLAPTPREIQLTGDRMSPAGWTLAAPPESTLARTGAEEINDRLTRLGGAPLPVAGSLPEGDAIVVASCTDPLGAALARGLGVTPEAPGEQGYAIDVIRRDGRTLLLAIGSDGLGALYACMTVRRLLQPHADGPQLLGASVRDWPAFKLRSIGRIGRTVRGRLNVPEGKTAAEVVVNDAKRYIRWLARHKINMAMVSVPGAAGPAGRKEVVAYGRRYGLMYRTIYGTAINHELEAAGAKWTECVVRKTARHCWTALEAHRLRARKLAERFRDQGFDCVAHHVVDSGGLPDPETWSRRCERCRAVGPPTASSTWI